MKNVILALLMAVPAYAEDFHSITLAISKDPGRFSERALAYKKVAPEKERELVGILHSYVGACLTTKSELPCKVEIEPKDSRWKGLAQDLARGIQPGDAGSLFACAHSSLKGKNYKRCVGRSISSFSSYQPQ